MGTPKQTPTPAAENQTFPIATTIGGVPVVTIPLKDYVELLDAQARREQLGKADRYPVPPRSPILADTAVKAFFLEHLGKTPMETILRECRLSFGKARTPSRTAAYRFWQRLRKDPSTP